MINVVSYNKEINFAQLYVQSKTTITIFLTPKKSFLFRKLLSRFSMHDKFAEKIKRISFTPNPYIINTFNSKWDKK